MFFLQLARSQFDSASIRLFEKTKNAWKNRANENLGKDAQIKSEKMISIVRKIEELVEDGWSEL